MEKSLKQFVRKKNISYSLCSKWSRRLHGHVRVVEHATVELLGQWCSGRSNDTPRWVAVSSGWRGESCYGRRVGARPTPHSPRDLGQGYWAATATVRWNLCIARQKKLHDVTSSVSWSIVSEEVSCYGTNRRQKVLADRARRHGNKRHQFLHQAQWTSVR